MNVFFISLSVNKTRCTSWLGIPFKDSAFLKTRFEGPEQYIAGNERVKHE